MSDNLQFHLKKSNVTKSWKCLNWSANDGGWTFFPVATATILSSFFREHILKKIVIFVDFNFEMRLLNFECQFLTESIGSISPVVTVLSHILLLAYLKHDILPRTFNKNVWIEFQIASPYNATIFRYLWKALSNCITNYILASFQNPLFNASSCPVIPFPLDIRSSFPVPSSMLFSVVWPFPSQSRLRSACMSSLRSNQT